MSRWAAFETDSVVTIGLDTGSWVWGQVTSVEDEVVELSEVRVATDVSEIPARGGRVATTEQMRVRMDAVVAVFEGIFREWR